MTKSSVLDWKKANGAAKYLPMLNEAERRYGIPTDLLARLAYQESHFRADIIKGEVRSPDGAVGIMQIVPKYHPDVDPLNVPQAIDYAARFLKSLYIRFSDWKLALAGYNAGAGNVEKYSGIPPFPETQNYVAQITRDVPVGVA